MREGFKNNEKFRSLVENVSDGIIALDHEWKVVYMNKAAERIMSRSARHLVEKNIWEAFPESVNQGFYRAYHRAMQTQESTVVEDYSAALGKWTRATIYPSQKGLVIYFSDITSQRTAEARAEKSEADYRLFLDRITDGFIVLDKQFRYLYVNRKIADLVQRDPESLLGKIVWEEFPEAVDSLTYKAFHTAFNEQRFISNIDYYEPLKLWQENYIYPSPEGLSIFVKDISDRKRLEKEIRDKEKNQQFELLIATLEAQEKERTYLAQELHDNVNQLLVASRLMLALVRDDPAKASGTIIAKCIDNLETAIEENRKISHELVTPDLKEQGLVDQLKSLLQTMLTPAKIKASVDASSFSEVVLDDPRKLAVYRVAQEQFTNITKYAHAKNVRITLSNSEDVFTMIIADDGVGMNDTKVKAGIGLRNIGARVGFFGGNFHVVTEKGKGFKLEVNIPIVSLFSNAITAE